MSANEMIICSKCYGEFHGPGVACPNPPAKQLILTDDEIRAGLLAVRTAELAIERSRGSITEWEEEPGLASLKKKLAGALRDG